MFRQYHILLATCLLAFLISASSNVFARDLTAGAEQPDQTFWQTIKDTTLPDLFAMFIERYPNSAHRAQAEQKLERLQSGRQLSALEQARLLTGQSTPTNARVRSVAAKPIASTRAPRRAPAPARTTRPARRLVPAPAQLATREIVAPLLSLGANSQYFAQENSPETILLIQYNLNRVGCTIDKFDGKWGPNTQASAARFARTIDQPLITITPNVNLLRILKAYEIGTCAAVVRPAPLVKQRNHYRPTRTRIRTKRRVRTRISNPRPHVIKRRKKARRKNIKKAKTRKRIVKRSRRKNARTSSQRRKANSRKIPNITPGRGGRAGSNRGGGQRKASRGGGGQKFSLPPSRGRGGSNLGGGQKRRAPGRGASNRGGGQKFRLPSAKKKGATRRFNGIKLNKSKGGLSRGRLSTSRKK